MAEYLRLIEELWRLDALFSGKRILGPVQSVIDPMSFTFQTSTAYPISFQSIRVCSGQNSLSFKGTYGQVSWKSNHCIPVVSLISCQGINPASDIWWTGSSIGWSDSQGQDFGHHFDVSSLMGDTRYENDLLPVIPVPDHLGGGSSMSPPTPPPLLHEGEEIISTRNTFMPIVDSQHAGSSQQEERYVEFLTSSLT